LTTKETLIAFPLFGTSLVHFLIETLGIVIALQHYTRLRKKTGRSSLQRLPVGAADGSDLRSIFLALAC
jgi:hypothetical protein